MSVLAPVVFIQSIVQHTVAMTLPRTKDQDSAFHSGRNTGAVVGVGVSSSARTVAIHNANRERICAVVGIVAGKTIWANSQYSRLPVWQAYHVIRGVRSSCGTFARPVH
jgi:hypothetical protein